jgi:hypothetical protein
MKYRIGDLFQYDDGGRKTYLAIILKYRTEMNAYELHWFNQEASEYFCSYGYTDNMLDNTLFWKRLS